MTKTPKPPKAKKPPKRSALEAVFDRQLVEIELHGWKKALSFYPPLPPSINHYYKRKRTGQIFLSKEATAFREALKNCEIIQHCPEFIGESPVTIHIKWHPKTKASYDCDNRIKSLLDAITHAGAWKDDKQVVRIIAEKDRIIKGGQCDVVIYIPS